MQDNKEFYIERFDPRPAIAFPDNNFFHPVNGNLVGTETNLVHRGTRFIFKYDSEPVRKSTNKSESWPNGELYLVERDIKMV